MERIWTTQLQEHSGQRVKLAGWLHRQRQLRSHTFLLLRDGAGVTQVVLDDPALIQTLAGLHNESVLRVEGTVAAEAHAPGGYEIHNPAITVVSPVSIPPPVDLYRPDLKAQASTILDLAALTLRHPKRHAYARLSAAAVAGFRAALSTRCFVEIHTPKLVAAATEGGANVLVLS